MSERIGFVGLGVMGRPMARNLLRAGYEVLAYTRTQEVLADLVRNGGRAAASPLEVAADVGTIITMLPNAAAVSEVVAGPDGLLAGARRGSLVVDMSTIEPTVARALAGEAASRGVHMLDAPVSGGDVGAREGTLSIMVGGDVTHFERMRPVFETLGRTITHVGPHGAGQLVKACNQVLVAVTYGAVAEALVLGAKSGIDPAVTLDVLSGGLGANRIMELRRANFLEHRFDPGFRVDLHHKDLGIALGVAAETDVALPLTAFIHQMFAMLRARGGGDLDHSALLTVVEEWAGTPRAAPGGEVAGTR